jgi:hypothetical protein
MRIVKPVRAWFTLLALSLAATGVAWATVRLGADVPAAILGATVLALSWAKARVILLDYLGLARAPSWRGGVTLGLALYALLLLGLYLAGSA